MAVPTKPDKAESQGVAGRRSTRLFISIPVSMSGKDSAGHTFKENSKTLIINKHGAKVATTHQVALGAEITVENRALGRTAPAIVVWLGDRASPKDPLEIGLQLSEAQNIWGIEFPPDDWQEGPPIGPRGQRLEKAFPTAPAKPAEPPAAPKAAAPPVKPAAPEAPAVAKAPAPRPSDTLPLAVPPAAAPPSAAPPSPEVGSAALEAATARFTQIAEAAAQAQAKSFEEKLARFTNDFGFRTQAGLQEAANRLEEKMVGSLEKQLAALETRLRASREGMEGLLAEFQELQKSSHSEVEKTRRSIEDASQKALQAALKALEGEARKELDAASSAFIQQTRKRLQEEGAAAAESFSTEASRRLAGLSQDFLSKARPELESRQKQLTEQAKAQIGQALQAASGAACEKIRQMASDVVPTLQDAMETSLAERAGQLINRLTQSFEEETQATTRAADESLRHALQKVQDAIQQEIANAATKVRESYQAEAEKANREVSQQIASSIEQTSQQQCQAVLDQVERGLEDIVNKALGFVKQKADQSAAEASDTVNKQLGSAAMVLKDWEDQARARLETHAQRVEAGARVSAEAVVEGLRKEANALLEDLEDRLQQAARVFEGKSMESIHARVQATTEALVETATAQLRKQTEENVELGGEQLREKQRQAVSQAEGLFRNSLAEMLRAVMATPPRKTEESSETEPTKKRL